MSDWAYRVGWRYLDIVLYGGCVVLIYSTIYYDDSFYLRIIINLSFRQMGSIQLFQAIVY